jgi:peptidoglycan hydrolase-like protein with peptidoglycan-binding domain
VTKRQLVSGGQMEWRPVLCETNATRDVVSRIQRALTAAGHNAGPADGVIGRQTLNAVASYQEKNRLPKGGLNYDTISALGVKVGR